MRFLLDNKLYEDLKFAHNYAINIATDTPWKSFPSHWHTSMEIIMPLCNDYDITVNSKLFHLNKNDIIFIFPGEIHSFQAQETYATFVLQFEYQLLSNLKNYQEYIFLFHQIRLIKAKETTHDDMNLPALLLTMKRISSTAHCFTELILYQKLLEFFVEIGQLCLRNHRSYIEITNQEHVKYVAKFVGICSYITTHCEEPLHLDEIAERAHVSKYHFSRLFKDFTGFTFHHFLTIQRVKKAELLLANPENTMTEIAYQSGFNSITTFNRAFKDIHSCSPSDYYHLYNNAPR